MYELRIIYIWTLKTGIYEYIGILTFGKFMQVDEVPLVMAADGSKLLSSGEIPKCCVAPFHTGHKLPSKSGSSAPIMSLFWGCFFWKLLQARSKMAMSFFSVANVMDSIVITCRLQNRDEGHVQCRLQHEWIKVYQGESSYIYFQDSKLANLIDFVCY